MDLQQLLQGLDYELRGTSLEISGLSYDSRQVVPGDLFVAIRGFQVDGHDFIQEAQANGAVAIMVEHPISTCDLPQIIVSNTRFALGVASANFYQHPRDKLKILGITGTNGKTTSTYLVKSILEQAGYKVGLIGTIQILIGDESIESSRTTPESLDLQRILARMVEAKVDFVVMEVSSHALELERTAGLAFAGALFTNLSQDHLDFHSNIEEYFQAKAKLFRSLQGSAVINGDDEWGLKLKGLCEDSVLSYGVENIVDFQAQKIQLEKAGVSYILDSEIGQIPINLRLTGYFNVYNSLGAATLCWSQGVSIEDIKAGLEAVTGVPGRFQRIDNAAGLNIIVDYAHTPDGLENILQTARELTTSGRIILVFGAGGDRDRSKRPLMGAVAARFADYIIITSDNPRSENPMDICSNIETGLVTTNPLAHYEVVVNRQEAIRKAVGLATPADLVIIAGKGHETYQEFATGRVHFDDGEEVVAAIKELKD